jgi:hypothetical protein
MAFRSADGSKRREFNQNSLVVRLNLGSNQALLMGDAEAGEKSPPTTLPAPIQSRGNSWPAALPI